MAGAAHSYDANGNLTSDGSTAYLYDIENRLVSASGAKNATLRYDPMGRLYETTGGSAGLTRLAYDGDALVQEFNSSGTLLRRYVHGTDAGDDPLVWFEGSGFTDTQQRLLRTDHQGSIVAVADATSAGIHAINSYDEYGNQSAANQGRFQYTGQTWMPELGLYYYKARMYSPTLGRFMQTDPIGYDDDVNLYAYVGSDPINKVDPSGTVAVVDDAVIVAGVVAVTVYVACEMYCEDAIKAAGEAARKAAEQIEEARQKTVTKIVDFAEAVKNKMESKERSAGARPSTEETHREGEGRRRYTPNKPGRKKQGREPGERKRRHPGWKPRNPPKEPPPHTPKRPD